MGKKGKLEKFNKLLDKYQSDREIVKIYREVTGGEADIYGVILNMSDTFMHLAEQDEFRFNGEVIIRMDHFDSIRCNEYDTTIKNILKGEKYLSKTKPKATKVDLASWATIFSAMMKADIHVIVECEDLKKPTFAIGPIQKVGSKSLKMHNYNPEGIYDDKLTQIKYKDITIVRFKDQYSSTFRKYLKEAKGKKKK